VDAMRALAEHSSWAVHITLKELARRLKVRSSDLRWIWCWELQERGALHLHIALELPSEPVAVEACSAWRLVWETVLRGVAKRSGIDIFARGWGGSWRNRPDKWVIDAQFAYGTVGQYLSSTCLRTLLNVLVLLPLPLLVGMAVLVVFFRSFGLR